MAATFNFSDNPSGTSESYVSPWNPRPRRSRAQTLSPGTRGKPSTSSMLAPKARRASCPGSAHLLFRTRPSNGRASTASWNGEDLRSAGRGEKLGSWLRRSAVSRLSRSFLPCVRRWDSPTCESHAQLVDARGGGRLSAIRSSWRTRRSRWKQLDGEALVMRDLPAATSSPLSLHQSPVVSSPDTLVVKPVTVLG